MEAETEPVTALVRVEELTPMQLFAPGALNPILERIKAEVRAIETDISTDGGRKAIKSLAYKIARTKTFIDEQRAVLVGDEKKRLAAIDTEGRRVREELDALKDEVREPLTQWENAETARIQEHERRIRLIGEFGTEAHISIALVDHALTQVDALWDHNFQEFTKRAVQARETALLHLDAERTNILREIAQKVEQERLRAEAEEKARVAREAKIAEDARLEAEAVAKRREEAHAREAKQREEEQARIAAEEKARLEKAIEDQRLAQERNRLALERERLAVAERERKSEQDRLAEQQKAEADRVAAARKAEDERIAAAEKFEADLIAAEKKAVADREAAVAAERKRQEDAKKADEDARAKRERDKKHQAEIHREALAALAKFGIEEVVAKTFIQLVARNIVPHVSITY